MHHCAKRSAVGLVVTAVALSGCNTSGGLADRFAVGVSPAANVCQVERKPLIETEVAFTESVIAGAVIGAVGGAVLGAMVGDGRAVGVLAGAALGAAAGGGVGYLEAKRKEAKNSAEILALVNKDTQVDRTKFSTAANAIPALQNCRLRQIDDLDRALAAKQVDKETARARLKEIMDAVEEDNKLINAVLKKSDERLDQYVRAIAVEKNLDETAAKTTITEAAKKRVVQAKARQGQGIAYAKANIDLLSTASKTAQTIAALSPGQILIVLEKNGSWRRVDVDGQIGFVQTAQISPSKPRAAQDNVIEVTHTLSASSADAFVAQIEAKQDRIAAGDEHTRKMRNISDRAALLYAKTGAPEFTPTTAAQ